MALYSWLEWVHILSAIVLFGGAVSLVVIQWTAEHLADARGIHAINERVRSAGLLLIAPTLVLQPVSGAMLAVMSNRSLLEDWIAGSLILYAIAATCWVLGARVLRRMLALSAAASVQGVALPSEYAGDARKWRMLNAFVLLAFFTILWVMVFKPD